MLNETSYLFFGKAIMWLSLPLIELDKKQYQHKVLKQEPSRYASFMIMSNPMWLNLLALLLN